jgi:uncharacterized protein YecA (UPF0149 family)
MGWFKNLFKNEPVPPEEALDLRRNDPCWCKSGKKYKKCHSKSDQDYFARRYSPSCGSGG